jgi:hypothetical protein
MPPSDLLVERRPHRADAARNFERSSPRPEQPSPTRGADAALDDIAQLAGVGPATP